METAFAAVVIGLIVLAGIATFVGVIVACDRLWEQFTGIA